MFSNFLYFAVGLLIFATYQPSKENIFSPIESILFYLTLLFLFILYTYLSFRNIEKFATREDMKGSGIVSLTDIDKRINSSITRLAFLALIFYFFDIYFINLVENISFFHRISTIRGIVFLGIFILYFLVIWACAYTPYNRIFMTDMSRKAYVLSNILFPFPVFLPWFIFSILDDIISVQPFEMVKLFISSEMGQIIYSMVCLFGIVIMGPAIIRFIWGCRSIEEGSDREIIDKLCRKSGVGFADILYWPMFGGSMITAGVMGLVKKFRYIMVTPAMLRFLEPEEIRAVISHEIGHVKKRHLFYYIFFILSFMILLYLVYTPIKLLYLSLIYSDYLNISDSFIENYIASITSAFDCIVIVMLFIIFFRFVFGYYMRNFERQADIYVYRLMDNAKPLISTFHKIVSVSGLSSDTPNWHHFSINERINYLEKCENDKKWIALHNKKIKKIMSIYIFIVLFAGAAGYNLYFGEKGSNLSGFIYKKTILKRIEKGEGDERLFSLLGDIYISDENYERAIEAYRSAIMLNPDNLYALNNLAWLYATCKDEKLRNPEEAVLNAEKAVRLENSPQVLDTLSEAYYVNGMYDKAIETGRMAFEKAVSKKDYFRKQLDKFIAAKKNSRG